VVRQPEGLRRYQRYTEPNVGPRTIQGRFKAINQVEGLVKVAKQLGEGYNLSL
jgi:hypothetical protein